MLHWSSKKFIFAVLVMAIGSLAFITFALAHGTGASLEQQTEGGFVDIGYSPEEITSDTSVVFDFSLLAEPEGKEIEFSDVWVRFVTNDSTVFATGVHNARIGGALLTYRFPEAGEYTLVTRFQNNGVSIAEVEFPISVITGGHGTDANLVAAAALVVGLVFGGLFGIYRGRFFTHAQDTL